MTEVTSEKAKPVKTNLEPTMSNLANGKVSLKFNYSVLVQNVLLHSILILF